VLPHFVCPPDAAYILFSIFKMCPPCVFRPPLLRTPGDGPEANNFLAQNLETKIVSMGICTVSCAPPRFGLLPYCHRFVQYDVRNCESTLMQLRKCFTVSPLWLAYLEMYQTTMMTKGRQLQRACKTRWLSSEATVRGRSEILAIWAALKQLSKI